MNRQERAGWNWLALLTIAAVVAVITFLLFRIGIRRALGLCGGLG